MYIWMKTRKKSDRYFQLTEKGLFQEFVTDIYGSQVQIFVDL